MSDGPESAEEMDMPGIVALKLGGRKLALLPSSPEVTAVETKKSSCSDCHLVFALAEERVEIGDRVYHTHCARKRERSARVRELFIRNAANCGLQVVPKHSFGK